MSVSVCVRYLDRSVEAMHYAVLEACAICLKASIRECATASACASSMDYAEHGDAGGEGGMLVKVKIGRVKGRREVRANHRTEGDCPMFRSGVSRGCVPR